MAFSPEPNWRSLRLTQYSKAETPIRSTLSGITILVSLPNRSNAESPISVRLSGRVIRVSAEPAKVDARNDFTPFGITISVILLPANADLPISTRVSGRSTSAS